MLLAKHRALCTHEGSSRCLTLGLHPENFTRYSAVSCHSRTLTAPHQLLTPRSFKLCSYLAPRVARRIVTARSQRFRVDNYELVAGDVISLVSFCLYKQVAAIVLSPAFPGWLAPLQFNPVRFAEFTSFSMTVCGAWVAACMLVGAYRSDSTTNLPTTLTRVSLAWLASMPVAAAQLVLVTALESGTLVGDEGFASHLPLAASGPGEPFATAAGVLGVMAIWRSYYSTYLDIWNIKVDRTPAAGEQVKFREALFMVCVMAGVSCLVLQGLHVVVWPDTVEAMDDMVSHILPLAVPPV